MNMLDPFMTLLADVIDAERKRGREDDSYIDSRDRGMEEKTQIEERQRG